MARPTRAAAQRSIMASTAMLDAEMLVMEQDAYDQIAAIMSAAATAGVGELLDALHAADPGDYAATCRRLLEGRAARALAETWGVVRDLLAGSAARALAAITAELATLERTVPARYAGQARIVADLAPPMVWAIIDAHTDAYTDRTDGWATAIGGLTAKEYVRWGFDDDGDLALLAARMYSPDPLRRPRRGGRGIWWRVCTWAQGDARERVTLAVNEIRSLAMAGWQVRTEILDGERTPSWTTR